jgi:hypothetical protein
MHRTLRNEEVVVWSRRQKLGLAAALLGLLMLGLWTLNPRSSKAPIPSASVKPQLHVSAAAPAPVPPDLVLFALNALLVPLLDDSVPPRWTDVVLEHICGPGTRVLIDGKPLERYSPMPATAFSVRWTLDRCLPFGFDGMELSGSVELQVFHEDSGLSAIVTPHHLHVDSWQGRSWLRGPFSAAMSLATAHRGGG